MTSGSPRSLFPGMATATFPSSRPAFDSPQGTSPQSPSQLRVADRVRAIHPCFALGVEELHRDEQPAGRLPDQPDELHAAAVAVRPLSDVLRRREHVRYVRQVESKPLGSSLADVRHALWHDFDCALAAQKVAWKHDPARHDAGDLRRRTVRRSSMARPIERQGWRASCPLWEPRVPTSSPDVLVVGAGAIGASVALHLAQAGAKVLRIIPFRGYYAELVPERCGLVRSHVYAAPDLTFPFLGVHLSRRTDGRVLVGPGAMLAFRARGIPLCPDESARRAGDVHVAGVLRPFSAIRDSGR
jgi:hypothetical protein